MTKKTIYIILISAAGFLIIGGLIWYLVFGAKPAVVSTGETGFTVPGGTNQGKLKVVSNDIIISAHFNNSQNSILFYDYSGQFWQLNSGETKATALNQSPVNNAAEIIWSSNLKNIVKTGTGQSDAQYLFSDFTKNVMNNLKSGIKSVVFSPDASKIVYYIFENQKTNSLFISNSDGKNQRTLISSFKLRDPILSWPKTNTISLVSRPSGLVAGGLWTLDTRSLGFNKLLSGVFSLETLWAPNGGSFIYSYVDPNGKNPRLAIYNKKGIAKDIGGISTLVDKCSWSKDSVNIYCAVPRSWPDFMILPDDYYKKITLTNDDVWKINTETGEKNLLVSAVGDINNLLFDEVNNIMFFTPRSSPFLYQFSLQ